MFLGPSNGGIAPLIFGALTRHAQFLKPARRRNCAGRELGTAGVPTLTTVLFLSSRFIEKQVIGLSFQQPLIPYPKLQKPRAKETLIPYSHEPKDKVLNS